MAEFHTPGFHITFLALIISSALVQSQIPIPTRPQGFPYKSSSCQAPVHLEIFTDLLCPNCKDEFPTVLKVADHYGPDVLSLNMLMFPLPYHRVGFLAAQGTFVVDTLSKGNSTYTWMKTMFDNQDKFYNIYIMDSTQNEVIDKLSKYAGQSGVDAAEFKKRLSSPSDQSDYDARVQWKYGCSRTVSGTPFTYINGIFVASSPSWTLSDWQKVIDPLLGVHNKNNNTTSLTQKSCPAGQVSCNYLPGKSECCLQGENCIPNVGCRC